MVNRPGSSSLFHLFVLLSYGYSASSCLSCYAHGNVHTQLTAFGQCRFSDINGRPILGVHTCDLACILHKHYCKHLVKYAIGEIGYIFQVHIHAVACHEYHNVKAFDASIAHAMQRILFTPMPNIYLILIF